LPKFIETKSGNYMKYHRRFSVIETLICLKIHRRLNKSIENKRNIVYSISLSNRQSNRTNQSGSQSVLPTLCKISAG